MPCSLAFRVSRILVVLALTALAFDAEALDGYRDRRGLFGGLAVGGGAALSEGEVGGTAAARLQLGGGATKWLALSLDVDGIVQRVDGFTTWMIVPGPRLDIFILNALFVSGGVGIACVFPEDGVLPDQGDNFTLGLNAKAAVGYEFFAGSNLAVDISLEADYYAIAEAPNSFAFGFFLGLRYY